MTGIFFRIYTILSLAAFPALPGLCRCHEATPSGHDCCPQEKTASPCESHCPQGPHLCLLTPSQVSFVEQSAFSSFPAERNSTNFPLHVASCFQVGFVSTAKGRAPDFLFHPFYPNTILSIAPPRGPPAHIA